jgi:hypothetical protein
MIKFDGVLYAALGTEYGAVVVASQDQGRTWQEFPLRPVSGNYFARAHSFFVVAGRLYVSTTGREGSRIFVLSRGTFLPMRQSDFFPGRSRPHNLLVHGYRQFRGQTVYIAADRVPRGHPPPVGLFAAADSQNVRAIGLAHDALPRAILVDATRLLVLATRKSGEWYSNHVFETLDLTEWRETFHFRTSAFARSFELLDGVFYFGLGSDYDDVKAETGEILRLPAGHAGGR